MRAFAWGWVLGVAACAQPREGGESGPPTAPVEAPRGPEHRGPGSWRPVAQVLASPVDVALITSGLRGADDGVASTDGARVAFTLDGQACTVDASTGATSSDEDVTPDGGGATTTTMDTTADGRVVALVDDVVMRTTGYGGERVDLGPAIAAVDIGGRLAAISPTCGARFEGGPAIAVSACPVRDGEVADRDGALVVATDTDVIAVAPGGVTRLVPRRVDHVAVDPGSGLVVTARGHTVTAWRDGAPQWTHLVDGGVLDLDDGGDLGLVLVWARADRDERVDVLDAATGELLGALDVRDATRGIDVSATGGLLVMRRDIDVVTWRITRG